MLLQLDQVCSRNSTQSALCKQVKCRMRCTCRCVIVQRVNAWRLYGTGAASASLMLSHWERLQVDPFFVPVTEEEREEFGEEGQGVGTANLARTVIDEVRRRKGLPTDKKVVEVSTKQRTRARKV